MLCENQQCLEFSNKALYSNENQKIKQSFCPISIVCDFSKPKLFNGSIKRKFIFRSTHGIVVSSKADTCFEKRIPLTKM